jgi:DNA-binding beta-propeller fold protein YncE
MSVLDRASGRSVDHATGVWPIGVAFDGSSIWVANNLSDGISKINPATSTRIDLPTGTIPGSCGDGPDVIGP